MDTTDTYAWADSLINISPRYATGFTQLLAAEPYPVSSVVRRLYDTRSTLIRAFQKTSLELFRAALANELHPTILRWFINETLDSFGLRYHRQLEDRHFTLPAFFRTDEVKPGRIIEINCPGGLWGELQLAFEYAARMGYCGDHMSPAGDFSAQLADYLQAPPVVHHFLDNGTAPGSWRYFNERTRPAVKYWGLDHNVRRRDCNFIRNPTFIGICTEDEFPWRISRVGQGITYDLPPHVLFDQKATLVLPFWSMTREAFSDDIRGLFPYTTPLLPTGIELPDGSCVTVEEFCHQSRSRRSYYLKYAGANWLMNFGSRAVYRLSNMSSDACLDFLLQCLRGYESGRIWLLQAEEVQDDVITYLTRDGAVHTERFRTKLGGFYGPTGCLGVIAQHSHHNKVHGRDDTVLSYVLPDGEGASSW